MALKIEDCIRKQKFETKNGSHYYRHIYLCNNCRKEMAVHGNKVETHGGKCRECISKTKINCSNCGTETFNKKYCSRTCSSMQLKIKPRRKLRKKCKICDNLIRASVTYCKNCYKDFSLVDYTLSEVIYEKHHKSSAFALVRSRARNALQNGSCEKCGYDKHTEVCHIKPISKFSLDTKLSIINSQDNLLRLCPNCHWEYDNLMVDSERLALSTLVLEGRCSI